MIPGRTACNLCTRSLRAVIEHIKEVLSPEKALYFALEEVRILHACNLVGTVAYVEETFSDIRLPLVADLELELHRTDGQQPKGNSGPQVARKLTAYTLFISPDANGVSSIFALVTVTSLLSQETLNCPDALMLVCASSSRISVEDGRRALADFWVARGTNFEMSASGGTAAGNASENTQIHK